MDSMIFRPPDRSNYIDKQNYPDHIKKIKTTHYRCKDGFRYYKDSDDSKDSKDSKDSDFIKDTVLTYSVIHPSSIKSKKSRNQPYIVWSHGNACDIVDSYPMMQSIHAKLNGNVGIIMYDYEGYGMSSGKCGEGSCYNSLDIMIEYCENELSISKNMLFLIGQSLGSGVVVEYAYKHADSWTTPIILLSPYKSISRVVVDPHKYDMCSNLMIRYIDKFCTMDKISSINSPIVIYHGIQDRLIGYEHSIYLYELNKQNTTLILLKYADHNNLCDHIDMREIWNTIFNHING
jgi:pimeloyl-ACP methyl ester carboxylesterase